MIKTQSIRDTYGDVLVKLGSQNPNIILLDADLARSTRTAKFAEAFPERFFNMGIAEQNMISTAAGLAAAGKIPFVRAFAVFATGQAWKKAAILEEGTDATVLAMGIMGSKALQAQRILKNEGISVRLLNMPTIKPIDQAAIITAAQETGAIVTAEEHSIIGGLGSAASEVLSLHCPVPLERIGISVLMIVLGFQALPKTF